MQYYIVDFIGKMRRGWGAQASHSPFDVCNAFLLYVYAWCNAVTSHKNTIIRTSIQITRRCSIECGGDGDGSNGARQRLLHIHVQDRAHSYQTLMAARTKKIKYISVFKYNYVVEFHKRIEQEKKNIKKIRRYNRRTACISGEPHL